MKRCFTSVPLKDGKYVGQSVRLLVATLRVGMTGFQDGSYIQWAQIQQDYLCCVKISFTHQ